MAPQPEKHYANRTTWLRAAVLGANDGIISTSSLLIGVAAAEMARPAVLIAGIAGLISGAMSMAAGEYVSVSAQSDSEKADLHREQQALDSNPEFEHQELTQIYIKRGLTAELAKEVSSQLMKHDALATHARDELGISDMTAARPVQAAITSAVAFSIGAGLPIFAIIALPDLKIIPLVATSSLFSLVLLGITSAYLGGARILSSVQRLVFWGALAMTITAWVGHLIA